MKRGSEQGGVAETAYAITASRRVQHLLAIAREHFVDRGFEAVSIDSIARAAGVSKETIYRHFADKEALFRAALEVVGQEFTQRALAVHHRAPTVVSELAGLARAILDSATDQSMFSALWVAVSVSRRMPDLAEQLHNAQWTRLEPVREALEHYARERGVNGPVEPELALDFGSLAVEGPELLMGFTHPDAATREKVAVRVATVFAQGLTNSLVEGAPKRRASFADSAPVATERPSHIRRLLSVATRHFVAGGYEGANLDAIGVEARVGRGTLYRHAGSKAGLFAAAMRMAAQDCAATTEPPGLPDSTLDRAALVTFLAAALENLASEMSIQLHRTVISQSRRDPALAREIYLTLRAPWSGPVAQWLASMGLGDDPEWYARQLLTLALRGNRLFAQGTSLTEGERQSYSRRATSIFLDGFISTLDRGES